MPSSGGEAPRRLTAGARDTAPRWAPDGKRIAFVRASERDGRTQPGQLYLLSMEGGEARALTELTAGAGNPAWSPDGTRLAFTSATEYKDPKASTEARPAGEKKSDVQVVTRAVYRENGNPGYVDNERRTHIFTISGLGSDAAPTPFPKVPAPTQLTDGEFSEGGIEWAPDGSKIYFVSTRVAEPYFEEKGAELYAVPAAGGAIAKIAAIEGAIGNVSVSPDGSKIAFVGSLRGVPIRSYSQSDLWVTELRTRQHAEEPDRRLRLRHRQRHRRRSGGAARAEPQADRLVEGLRCSRLVLSSSAEKGSSNLKRVSIATGKLEPLSTGEHDVVAFSAAGDASKIAATVSTQSNIGDISIVDVAGSRQPSTLATQITRVNEELFKDIQQSTPEEIWYKSFDGRNIQGWILKPPDFDASKKYPLILEIHGGPHSAYGNTYTHEFQWMAAKGYVVLFTNPRGSTTYGQDFGNIIQYHYPGDDYKDLMAGVDEVAEAGLRRRQPARRHRRQRRRPAHQLDDHADAALQGRGRAARHRRLVTASGSRPTSRSSSRPGSARRRGRIRRTSPRARRSRTSRR